MENKIKGHIRNNDGFVPLLQKEVVEFLRINRKTLTRETREKIERESK